MYNNNYHATYDANLILEIDENGKIVSISLQSEVNSFDRCKHLTQGKYRSIEDHNKIFEMLEKNYGYLNASVEAISGDVKISMRDPVKWGVEDFSPYSRLVTLDSKKDVIPNDVIDKSTRRINELMEDNLINNEPLSIENVLSSVLNEQLVRLDHPSQGLTHSQIDIACRNIGINLACGGCAQLFYTGYNDVDLHDENCTRHKDTDTSSPVSWREFIPPRPHLICPKCKVKSYATELSISNWKCSSCGEVSSQRDWIIYDKAKTSHHSNMPKLPCPICRKLADCLQTENPFGVECSECHNISRADAWLADSNVFSVDRSNR